MTRLFLTLMISCFLSAFAAEQKANKVTCHLKANEQFAVVEINTRQDNNFLKGKLLYSVSTTKATQSRILGLISTVDHTIKVEDLNWIKYDKKFSPTILKESPEYDKLKKEWETEFKKKLKERAQLYEDTELEYLLHLKFFNQPLSSSRNSWKNEDILDFIFRLGGFQDVSHAIPLDKKFALKNQQYTEAIPESISLPKVNVPKMNIDIQKYHLATFIPRSCYYIEFPNIEYLMSSVDLISSQFSKWSGKVYPKEFNQAIEALLKDSSLPLEEMLKSPEKYGRITVSGWDPYYQSGTSLLIVVEKGNLQGAEKSYQHKDSTVFSNSKKLLSMSKAAFEKEKSLIHDPAFIHSREKLKANKNERFFAYLSDYWLTNFLSARWQILSGRLAECDARIRLTEILRATTQAELNLKSLPSVEKLRAVYKEHQQLTWIMRDLKLEQDRVIHAEYGALNNHTSIDKMPFTKVSKHEQALYEKFKRLYTRNWREMDPLAFQINKEKDHWFSRLYISPISKLSGFREISQIVLPVKETHDLREIPNSAFGLSLKFKTDLIKSFVPIKISPILQVSARGMDMAPHVDTLAYIHKSPRSQDNWSFTRMPIIAELPSLLLPTLRPIVGGNESKSDYPNIFKMDDITNDWLYNIFYTKDDDGYSRFAVNPTALMSMTANMKETQKTSHPSDIYGYLDFTNGYMLHRFIAIEAAKNRVYANWRRSNRMTRIEEAIGIKLHPSVFPQEDGRYKSYNLPKPEDDEQLWGAHPSSQVKSLPMLLKILKKLELFISVEPNALLFETKVYLQQIPEEQRLTRPEIRTPPEQQAPEKLDFDAQ
ncbi:MAG: hypothetical protein NE328_11555 [Lentisphaeraceae bacterium]|nr:hypothetical protein [Lentisphaeraceae bacterium]